MSLEKVAHIRKNASHCHRHGPRLAPIGTSKNHPSPSPPWSLCNRPAHTGQGTFCLRPSKASLPPGMKVGLFTQPRTAWPLQPHPARVSTPATLAPWSCPPKRPSLFLPCGPSHGPALCLGRSPLLHPSGISLKPSSRRGFSKPLRCEERPLSVPGGAFSIAIVCHHMFTCELVCRP